MKTIRAKNIHDNLERKEEPQWAPTLPAIQGCRRTTTIKPMQTGIEIGMFNPTGSTETDPYED